MCVCVSETFVMSEPKKRAHDGIEIVYTEDGTTEGMYSCMFYWCRRAAASVEVIVVVVFDFVVATMHSNYNSLLFIAQWVHLSCRLNLLLTICYCGAVKILQHSVELFLLFKFVFLRVLIHNAIADGLESLSRQHRRILNGEHVSEICNRENVQMIFTYSKCRV